MKISHSGLLFGGHTVYFCAHYITDVAYLLFMRLLCTNHFSL